MKNLTYGSIFFLLAVPCFILPFQQRGPSWLMLWPGLNFAWIALAFFTNNANLLGKRKSGRLRRLPSLFLAPFLIYSWAIWNLARRMSREPPFHEINASLYIGRRLLASEFDPRFQTVVDLAAEFREPGAIVKHGDYRSFPIMNAAAPDPPALAEFIDKLHRVSGIVYIHCAQGHGRTALIAACLLIARGQAATPEDALRLIQEKRPLARLNSIQHRALTQFHASCSSS